MSEKREPWTKKRFIDFIRSHERLMTPSEAAIKTQLPMEKVHEHLGSLQAEGEIRCIPLENLLEEGK
ncbi:MAG: hypothetical protein PHG85_01585 [Candidatus Altiarchaeota archaeon]|nr:hypothetical protein [Candidatus Altiarchaeota archaeon]